MTAAVCTLTDATFEPGCAALLSSLHDCGFRGRVVVGLVGTGHVLPARVAEAPPTGLDIAFLSLPDRPNVNAHKPFLLGHCLQDPAVDAAFFFDADIVCCKVWRHFEDWVANGIAVCSDVNFLWMPPNHPHRAFHRRALGDLGLPCRDTVGYANGGFLGLRREHAAILDAWQRLLDWIDGGGGPQWDGWSLEAGFGKYDQDALNAALMAVEAPVAFVGPEGMSFAGSLGYMVHPIGPRKPWKRGFLRDLVLHGRPLPLAARSFWKHVDGPVRVMGRREQILARIEMDVTAALSRLIGR